MQRFSENGARPVVRLGGLTAQPLRRLGALVFRPHITEPLYWASRSAPTRIAGCAWGPRRDDTRWKNVPSEYRCPSRRHGRRPQDPPASPGPRNEPGHAPTPNGFSFSLWTVFAEPTRKTPGRSLRSGQERLSPQSTGGLSAQVALLQSPILSAAALPYCGGDSPARSTRTMT